MIGREVSHYRIVERLGEGGMGAVYRAEDLKRDRLVALKILRPETVGGPSGRERLRREARACVELRHPNITEVYEVGEEDDISFIAMELVHGETVRALLGRGPLPWRQLAEIGRQVASALGRAHRHVLIHRDIKPENLMVDPEGRVKVLDFGLARVVGPDSAGDVSEKVTLVDRITKAGAVVGTVEYLSPEQAQGRDAGPASDTFSMGIVLYEMASGRLPFRGDNVPSLIHAIVYDHPEPVRAFRPDAPPAMESLLRQALQKRIDRRFADGSALEAALESALEQMPDQPAEAPIAPALTPVPAAGPSLAPGGRMVGRQAELDLLREMLRSIAAGSGRAVWIAGEAGCGKSRLMQELTAHGERTGTRVLRGECPVREGVRPYHPFAEALADSFAEDGVRDSRQLREHLEGLELGLGSRASVLANLLQLPSGDEEAPLNKEQVLDAVTAYLGALSRRQPLLLLLDDLHWADPETLDLLGSLARALGRMRLLLVGTYRPEDLTATEGMVHPLVRVLDRADREAPSARVPLRRLDREETTELVEEMLGGAEAEQRFADAVFLRTEGNPLFVLELIQMLRVEGALSRSPGGPVAASLEEVGALPGRVRDIIARRLRHLSELQRKVLEVAAVEGASFRSATLESCLGLDRLEILTTLQVLERDLQLVHAEGDRYRFDHPLIREALVEEIIPELRREYHRRVGRHLRDKHGNRPEHAAAIAYQLMEARDEEAALPYLMTAAAAARRVFANEPAIGYLGEAERVLARRQPVDDERLLKVYERRGELLQMVGRYDEARVDFRRLGEGARRCNDQLRLAMAHNRLGGLRSVQGDHEGALEEVEHAREAARGVGDARALADAAAVAGQVHYHRGSFDAALEEHTASMELRKELGDSAGVAHNLNKIGNIRYYQGEYEWALTAYQAALEMERELGDRRGMAESLMNLGAVYLQKGDGAASLEHHRASLEIKREIGDRRSLSMSLNNLALALEAMGRLHEARGHHEESLAIKREIGDPRGVSTSLANLAAIHERAGDFEALLRAAEESLSIKESIRDQMSKPYALNEVGVGLLALGRPDEAEARHREALEVTRQVGDRTEEAHSLRRLGEVALERGDPAAACSALAESLSVAREVQVLEGEMEALYALGVAQVGSGRLESAAATAGEMRRGSEDGRPEFRAKCEHLLGLVAARSGRLDDARQHLLAALDGAAEVGLRDLQWRMHADLAEVRSGGRAGPEGSEDLARARLILEDLAARIADPAARASFLARPGPRRVHGGGSLPPKSQA